MNRWWPTVLAVACALLATPSSSSASQVTVSSVAALHSALLDASVSEVILAPGNWNITKAEWPSQVVLQRNVTMQGPAAADGSPHYVDANRLLELVVVGTGGGLHQRNLFLDDCLVPIMPLLCFVVGAENGNITLESVTLGDSSCVDIGQSTATDWLLKSAYWATWRTSWHKVDDRTIYVQDTGEVRGMPHGVRWRLINSTFHCTANETHPLPVGASGTALRPTDTQLMAATVAIVLAVLATWYYFMNRNVVTVSRSDSPEVVVARSKGIVLQALIGQGTFGRVYRGRYHNATVAVKVIEFPMLERRAAVEVHKECQHAMAARHPCITRCITYFTVTVRTHLQRTSLVRTTRDAAEAAYVHERLLAQQQQDFPVEAPPDSTHGAAAGQTAACALFSARQGAQQLDAAHQPSNSRAEAVAELTALPGGSSLCAAAVHMPTRQDIGAAGEGSDEGSTGASSRSSMDVMSEGMMTLLVMEYCSLGNLHRAIQARRFFASRSSKQLRLDWVCRTAWDVARGLAHLHEERQLVHRDVSTNNVLLLPEPSDPRGFQAKLSDFGLSTVLRDCQTHKTSQLKGTVDFMPPEIFTCGEIRFAVDVYGLGIVVLWMCRGEGPYAGLAPFQVVGRKLDELHQQQPLELPDNMPPELQSLVRQCTHWDPLQRPTAAAAARQLEVITMSLAAGPSTSM